MSHFTAPHYERSNTTIPTLDLGKPAATPEEYKAQAAELTRMSAELAERIATMKAAIANRKGFRPTDEQLAAPVDAAKLEEKTNG